MVSVLLYRSTALAMLGYPTAGLADADRAIKEAREIDQASSLMAALAITSMSYIHCGNYTKANAQLDEVVKLANEKGTLFWRGGAMAVKGSLLAVTERLRTRSVPSLLDFATTAHMSNRMDADVLVIFRDCARHSRPTRRCLAVR